MNNKEKIPVQTVIDVLRSRMLDVHAYSILAEMGIEPPPRKWKLVVEVETSDDLDDWFRALTWIEDQWESADWTLISSEEIK